MSKKDKVTELNETLVKIVGLAALREMGEELTKHAANDDERFLAINWVGGMVERISELKPSAFVLALYNQGGTDGSVAFRKEIYEKTILDLQNRPKSGDAFKDEAWNSLLNVIKRALNALKEEL